MKKILDTMLVLAMLASCVPGLAEDRAQDGLPEGGKSAQTPSGGEDAEPPVQPTGC